MARMADGTVYVAQVRFMGADRFSTSRFAIFHVAMAGSALCVDGRLVIIDCHALAMTHSAVYLLALMNIGEA
jgi:hypothetical protein